MKSDLEAVINLFSGTARAWRGTMLMHQAQERPEKMLKLYDLDISPYCRLVREALCEMDLDVLVLPCPKGGKRYRPEAKALLKNTTFPLLVDDNTGVVMNESDRIIDYLAKTYKSDITANSGFLRKLDVATSFAASVLQVRPNGMGGMHARPSKAPEQPLELYSFEASPYSKIVKARLCELEIPYILRNTAKGKMTDMGPPLFRDKLFKAPKGTTRNRRWLEENTGKVQVPYLVDPNTGAAMYESAKINAYLDKTYGA